jgi:hypothetical protein
MRGTRNVLVLFDLSLLFCEKLSKIEINKTNKHKARLWFCFKRKQRRALYDFDNYGNNTGIRNYLGIFEKI